MKRRAFTAFTFVLLAVTGWMVFANVLVDDSEVRALAERTARSFASCAEKCAFTGIHGERGMLSEETNYDLDNRSAGGGTDPRTRITHVTVVCRRKLVVVGDYACVAN